jgi:hypothetical protein
MSVHPQSLDDWTLDYIRGLLERHVFEDVEFDWKETVDGRDGRLRRNAVGMANNGGGFFIFGVSDNRNATPVDRLVGLDNTVDVAMSLSHLLTHAPMDPGVPFQAAAPMPILPRNRVVVVAQIFPTRAPHSVDGVFYGREPGATRYLTTQEVANLIIRREERLSQVRLLLLELKNARDAAVCIVASHKNDSMKGMREFDTRMLGELHADLVTLLAEHPQLSSRLSGIRALGGTLNFDLWGVRDMLAAHAMTSGPKAASVLVHLISRANYFANECEQLIDDLARTFGVQPPPLDPEQVVFSTIKV